MNVAKDVQIYLVGFPKSGTSWLIRLMANLLRIPIKNNKVNQESTVEINKRLNLKSESDFIAKVHLLPNFFHSEIDAQPQKIIYIYRDVRAVAISAFFYFEVPKRFSYLFLLKNNVELPFVKNLLRIGFYPFARMLMAIYIRIFQKKGLRRMNVDVGTWQQNIQAWKKQAKDAEQNGPQVVFVSYEDLLENPFNGVQEIIKGLNLPKYPKSQILEAIESESFKSMKTRLKQENNPVESAKLRVGVKSDWKNYLSNYNLKQLKKELAFYKSLL